MNYQLLSPKSLVALHQGIHRALTADDAQPPHLREYGVRLFRHWTVHSHAIEAALAAKGVVFIPTGL
ncbi:hypothetical protein SAMN02799636_01580 [Methylobacterium sp. 275MFSha3.1]|uniref:hypothetical protein n=1 Tax=Methylobacterium sp. 275MFSha3.1 TaxID=1502746 RepID=UPI0008A7682D|nr:hypothetical protein [Methylobacterium sp. 275MFSha3.1]SEH34282.1 hypothetical protein SAMN02799636_01580 [Methylobacterium sp. 275MFSha3.1]